MNNGLTRRVAVAIHTGRQPALDAACRFVATMPDEIECLVVPGTREYIQASVPGARLADITAENLPTAEVVVVFGGDGTILRAAQRAMQADIPVLGVNLGHVGFLAELEEYQVPELVSHVVARDFVLERRMTIEAELRLADSDEVVWRQVALNEFAVEKISRMKMIDVLVSIDDLPVSRWATDGILVSTPTGSTAYAFSAGGPVMWPQLEAFQIVPLAAHALFARAMVLAPTSVVRMDLLPPVSGVVCCDGGGMTDMPPGSRLTIRRHPHDLIVARLSETPFTSRLVKKFALPVEGWRGRN